MRLETELVAAQTECTILKQCLKFREQGEILVINADCLAIWYSLMYKTPEMNSVHTEPICVPLSQ